MTRIHLKDKEGTTHAKPEEIIRLQADGSSTHFHLRNGKKLTVSRSLKYWLEKLTPWGKVIRTHKSHAVNIHDIFRTERHSVILRDEAATEVPLSKQYRQAVKQAMDKAGL